MATTEKIRKDIEKTREKIAEQQKRLRALEAQLTEEENLEIVRMVKACPHGQQGAHRLPARLRQRHDLPAGRADGDGGKRGCGR